MADLTGTTRWIQYAPDLLGNRELEAPFYFELNGSMSKEQLKALEQQLNTSVPVPEPLPADAAPEQFAARDEQIRMGAVKAQATALTPFIRFGAEPLNVGGEPIDTLEKFFDFASSKLSGLGAFLEPSRALFEVNVLGTRASFFSGRLSGGFISTTGPRNGKAGRQTAAR
jgi:hypothetical protein